MPGAKGLQADGRAGAALCCALGSLAERALFSGGWSFPRFSFPLLPKVPPTCGLVSSVLLVQTPLRGTCCRHLLTQLLR